MTVWGVLLVAIGLWITGWGGRSVDGTTDATVVLMAAPIVAGLVIIARAAFERG